MNADLAPTAARRIVEALIANGIERVFCVPGESYLALLDALADVEDRIQVVACRHEGAAAHMAEAYGKLTGRPGICMVTRGAGRQPRGHRRAHRRAGLHPDDPADRPGGARRPGTRGVPGGRLRPDVRQDRQVGLPDRRSRAHRRDHAPRLRHGDPGAARAGGHRPARRHPRTARRPVPPSGPSGVDGPGPRCPGEHRRPAGAGRAAHRHPRRLGLERAGARHAGPLAVGEPSAHGAVVPAQGPAGQHPRLLRRRPGPGPQSQAGRTDQVGRPDPAVGARLGENPTQGLQPVHAGGDGLQADPHPSGPGGAGPGLAGGHRRGGRRLSRRPGAGDPGPQPQHGLAALAGRRARGLRGLLRADQGQRPGEPVPDRCAHGRDAPGGRHRLQRRGQLRRLAAPLLCPPRLPHPTRADLRAPWAMGFPPPSRPS